MRAPEGLSEAPRPRRLHTPFSAPNNVMHRLSSSPYEMFSCRSSFIASDDRPSVNKITPRENSMSIKCLFLVLPAFLLFNTTLTANSQEAIFAIPNGMLGVAYKQDVPELLRTQYRREMVSARG